MFVVSFYLICSGAIGVLFLLAAINIKLFILCNNTFYTLLLIKCLSFYGILSSLVTTHFRMKTEVVLINSLATTKNRFIYPLLIHNRRKDVLKRKCYVMKVGGFILETDQGIFKYCGLHWLLHIRINRIRTS